MADYPAYTWSTGDTITAARLNNLESQYATAKAEMGAGNWPVSVLRAPASAALQIGANNALQWGISTSGHLYPLVNDTYQIGDASHVTSAAFIRRLYLQGQSLVGTIYGHPIISQTAYPSDMLTLEQPSDTTSDYVSILASKPNRSTSRLIFRFYDKDHGNDAFMQTARLITGEICRTGSVSGDNQIVLAVPLDGHRQWFRARNGGTTYTPTGFCFSHFDTHFYFMSAINAALRVYFNTSFDYIAATLLFSLNSSGLLQTLNGFAPISDNGADLGSSSYRFKDAYIAGNLIGDGYAKAAKNVMFKAYLSANQLISSGSDTVVQFNAESFDPLSVYSTSTYRFTAPVAGYYHLVAHCTMDSLGDGVTFYVQILSFNQTLGYSQNQTARATGYITAEVNEIVHLAAGEWVEVHVFHNAGTAKNLLGGSGPSGTTYFAAHLLSKA